jgi:type IV pilus assembly protein PilM
MLSGFFRIVPPPTYLTMPCVGVDISDTSLKYLSFEPTTFDKEARVIKQWGDFTIPSGVITRGEVTDPSQLVAVLKEFKEKTKAEFVRLSLPEEKAYLFETTIKRDTSQKEMQGLLEFKLEENVPIPAREVFFDYSIMPATESSSMVDVSVVAYPRQTIQSYYEACIGADIRPVSFEIEAQAMARAVIPKNLSGAAMLIDFGKTRTGIGIVFGGALLYTSTIDIGGEQLSQVLRKALGDKSEAELTTIKNTIGLVRETTSSEVRDTLISTISVIKDEIITRMQYWHLRSASNEERRITSVVLCGGSSNLKGLPDYLHETLGVPVVRGNVWENAFSLNETIPPISRRYSFGYAAAIGLALKSVV